MADYALGQPVVSTIGFYIATDGVGGWESIVRLQLCCRSCRWRSGLVLGGQVCIWGETFNAAALPVLAYSVAMGAAENYWGKYDGNGGAGGTGDDGTSAGVASAAATGNATYWWQFNASTAPATCRAIVPALPIRWRAAAARHRKVARRRLNTTGCGGQFPTRHSQKRHVLVKKAPSTVQHALRQGDHPQPDHRRRRRTGAWALRSVQPLLVPPGNVGVQSPPSMPSYCGAWAPTCVIANQITCNM